MAPMKIDNTPSPTPPTKGKAAPSTPKVQSYTVPSGVVVPPVSRDSFGVTNADGTYYPPGGTGPDYGGGNYMDPVLGMSDEDWLSGDSAYQAQLAALLKALADSEADFTSQRTRYDTDYNDALRSLGWTSEVADDPNTVDVNESRPGAWNFQDLNTASGRAFTNQQNDFASRGLLQSSLYGTALDNLQRSLNDQLGSINTGRTNFLDDLTKQQTAAKNENTLGQQQARAEALARRASGLSIV